MVGNDVHRTHLVRVKGRGRARVSFLASTRVGSPAGSAPISRVPPRRRAGSRSADGTNTPMHYLRAMSCGRWTARTRKPEDRVRAGARAGARVRARARARARARTGARARARAGATVGRPEAP